MSSGFCECGCGGKTKIAKQSVTARGQVKGQPVRFIKGHSGHKFAPGETTIAERWWVEDRGYETPCWTWLLAQKRGGYGNVMAEGRNQVAHRYYYEQHNGKLPKGTFLDHLCRNRLCVNPDHLEPVTNAENSRRGANCKLSRAQVEEVRRLVCEGWKGVDIAAAYGITSAQVSNIKLGKSWA